MRWGSLPGQEGRSALPDDLRQALQRYARLEIEARDFEEQIAKLQRCRNSVVVQLEQLRRQHGIAAHLRNTTGSVAVQLGPNLVVTLAPHSQQRTSYDLDVTVARRVIGTES